MEVKICSKCNSKIFLRNVVKKGKSEPANYYITNDDYPIYYHKQCYTNLLQEKKAKDRLTIGVNVGIVNVSYEHEFR